VRTRRELLIAGVAGLFLLAVPLASFAQQQGKGRRIGFLYFGSRQSAVEQGRTDVFLQSMRDLGYAAGKDFIVEERYSDGKAELVQTQAAELARLKVDVIVATGNPAIHAARRATTTIPIIATTSPDPVAEGFAASLARPGGNVTGFLSSLDLTPKNLELLMAAVPGLSRVAVLMNPTNTGHSPQLKTVQAAAQKAGMQILAVKASTPDDIERGIAAMARDRSQALLIMGDNFFSQQARQIAELALKHRLPSIFTQPIYTKVGGLMSFGQDANENIRRAAGYVDKIFKGTKAGELPFERYTRTYMAINRKTAKALGITISQELLLRADEVIE
jgi:putative ABC transport system substrate-binding protein